MAIDQHPLPVPQPPLPSPMQPVNPVISGWVLAAYALVVAIWSTTPLAIKWSAEAGSPFAAVSIRMALAALIGLIIMSILGRRLPMHHRAWLSYAAAFPGIFLAMALSYFASQQLDSGLISVLFGLGPILSGLMVQALPGSKPLVLPQWLGSAIGLLGLAIIFWPQGNSTFALQPVTLVLLAVVSFSASSLAVQRTAAKLSPLEQTLGGLLLSLPAFALLWWFSGEPFIPSMTLRGWWATLYLGVFGSMIGFLAFYFILSRLSAVTVALITLMTPINAMLLGVKLNGEQLGLAFVVGALVVLFGLSLYLFGRQLGHKVRLLLSRSRLLVNRHS